MIYLLSPESDATPSQEGEEGRRENEQEEDGDGEEGEEKEKDEEDGDDRDERAPSLMWLMKKLSLMAKREAAHTPKVPLKVPRPPFPGIHSFSE